MCKYSGSYMKSIAHHLLYRLLCIIIATYLCTWFHLPLNIAPSSYCCCYTLVFNITIVIDEVSLIVSGDITPPISTVALGSAHIIYSALPHLLTLHKKTHFVELKFV